MMKKTQLCCPKVQYDDPAFYVASGSQNKIMIVINFTMKRLMLAVFAVVLVVPIVSFAQTQTQTGALAACTFSDAANPTMPELQNCVQVLTNILNSLVARLISQHKQIPVGITTTPATSMPTSSYPTQATMGTLSLAVAASGGSAYQIAITEGTKKVLVGSYTITAPTTEAITLNSITIGANSGITNFDN